MRLLPPDDKKVGYTLCDPCGDGKSQTVTLTFPTPDKVKSGDLGAWIGKSPAGTWTLDVTDSKFCLPQVAPKLCSLTNKTDGTVDLFEISAKVLASSKVAAKATLQLQAGLMHTVATKAPRPCDAAAKGFTYFDDTRKALRICNGQEWFDLYVQAPGSKSNPAESCKALLTLSPQSKSDVYWLDPDGPGGTAPFQALCDMETDGGGWTLVGTVYGGDANNWNTQYGYWSDTKALGDVKAPFVDYKSPAWWTIDTSKAEVLFERRYDGKLKAQVKLDAACQKGKATFNALFTTWDTNIKCGTSAITVVTAPANAEGVSSDSYREGQSDGLGGKGTNGWCWNGGDSNSNTFKGHAGWNQSGYGCLDAGHLAYIGVWQKGDAQYKQVDIDTTNWLYNTTTAKTAVSFYVR
ncbi:MAG: hypothetical protein H6747_15505 [Deltaproteobacteria bacterium]|nr:hypothetical protein [Deltaproteobacteria bacterium]